MNSKQLTLLVVVGILVGGLGYYLNNRHSQSWQSSGDQLGKKLVTGLDVNEVAQLSIKQTAGELNLVKQDDGWKVKERGNYPANFGEISDNLRKIADLKVVQTEEVGPSQLGRLELLEPGKGAESGTLVELKDKSGKTLKGLLLGKKHLKKPQAPSQFGGDDGYPDGRYVMLMGEKTVAVISDPLSSLESKPEIWVNKDFFKVEKPKLVSLVGTNATNSWKISRDTEMGEWKLADLTGDEKTDNAKAGGLNYLLSSASFNDVYLPSGKSNETPNLEAPVTATIETFEGFTYNLKFAKLAGEENYHFNLAVAGSFEKERTPGKDEKAEDKAKLDKEFKDKLQKFEDKLKQEKVLEKWTYIVSKWTIDPLLKERKDFLAEKKEEPKKDEEKKDGDPKSEEKKEEAAK